MKPRPEATRSTPSTPSTTSTHPAAVHLRLTASREADLIAAIECLQNAQIEGVRIQVLRPRPGRDGEWLAHGSLKMDSKKEQ